MDNECGGNEWIRNFPWREKTGHYSCTFVRRPMGTATNFVVKTLKLGFLVIMLGYITR